MIKIAVLVSGSGSNLQALIDANLSGQIVGVISNKPEAYALERATKAGIATRVIEHKNYPNRETFDDVMHQQLKDWDVDLVILAGFMRILSAPFVNAWQGKMVNIHPSLLPNYKGMHTHERVLKTGDVWHGCTVHYVTAELDAGQALTQGILKVDLHDNVQSLAARVHVLEHLIYPQAVEWICNGTLQHLDNGQVLYKGQMLEKPIQFCQF
ncbi:MULTISPECIES: phosphoribosylglycinamide formyltransferase [Acinetobacter]|jgi:phosphoribosylglycinamide formyltransferase-1|uniref:Phosphoribosylglycinamide formyltransferase n=2 Tax=Acinetobacter bereziniae TaxID=106648 RepID=A0A0A8TVN2_ACIBZ|nr:MULTISPECIES: phosphoribosylglycinamide formyltransferase [Acinetobacter]MEC8124645.1 phosphoribosylglycinamide formyltransferase [Pseudomonadota bacterium]ATZ63187.1 phosphoribosylglycinamide formyltransferase [Acinetobacter bereziniae]ENW00367.1 phosphoribosylglycinamide formyltransferase [Acinetobacter bereziniae LMG 1003 = CIP 70.12]KKW79766.1 phosphoribosylglycinamide formyltransferase [Acinetobacter sp. Ag2]MBI0396334.1 phosphoribosylglycinamide formyltransferase [Acinetobacter berezi